jgi:hypothetical protein
MRQKQITSIIQKYMPMLNSDSLVFQELLKCFSENALIQPDTNDLISFLSPRRLFNVIKIKSSSAEGCSKELLQKHPLFSEAAGMIRYYNTPSDVNWADIERAETTIGKTLAMDIYDWKPDMFTVFNSEKNTEYELVMIIAFSSEF